MWSIRTISKFALAAILVLSTISVFSLSAEPASAATIENALVNTKDSNLTVRKGPGTHYKKVGSLKKGKSVTVYSKTKSGWSKIHYNKKEAYVSTKYLLFSPVKITKEKYKKISDLPYPQVSGLTNKKAQDKINQTFTNHAKKAYKAYVKTHKKNKSYEYITQYKVKYNQDGKLSILLDDYIFEGGAHGSNVVTSYNFKVSSGKQVKISDILTSKQKYKKVQQYAYKYMSTHDDFYVDQQSDVPVNKHSQFYYSKDGIYLIFQIYDVAPYSSGNPSVKIPSSVYK